MLSKIVFIDKRIGFGKLLFVHFAALFLDEPTILDKGAANAVFPYLFCVLLS